MNEVLKISLGFERFIFMLIIYLVLQHIIACLWIFTARFADDSKETWIYRSQLIDATDVALYISAFYFTVTTVVTVGYGDITAVNSGEKAICILLMLIGVIAFSFGTGALSSIIANYDSSQARVKEKMSILHSIKAEYKLSNDLHNRLIKSITYDYSKTTKDIY
jgi:Ion channel